MTPLTPFHLAIPVNDTAIARDFYGGVLARKAGVMRSGWILTSLGIDS
jgi:extradiol dioxygenase family protein